MQAPNTASSSSMACGGFFRYQRARVTVGVCALFCAEHSGICRRPRAQGWGKLAPHAPMAPRFHRPSTRLSTTYFVRMLGFGLFWPVAALPVAVWRKPPHRRLAHPDRRLLGCLPKRTAPFQLPIPPPRGTRTTSWVDIGPGSGGVCGALQERCPPRWPVQRTPHTLVHPADFGSIRRHPATDRHREDAQGQGRRLPEANLSLTSRPTLVAPRQSAP